MSEATAPGELIVKKQATVKPRILPAVMTVRELADYLRVHPSTIYRLLKRRQIPGFRIDGDWRFHVKAIDEWRSRMEARPSSGVFSKPAGKGSAHNCRENSARTGT